MSGKRLSESETGTEVLPADGDVAMIIYAGLAHHEDFPQSWIRTSHLVVSLGPGRPEIIAKAKVEGEARGDMPIVLHIGSNLIGAKRGDDQVKVACGAGGITQQQR